MKYKYALLMALLLIILLPHATQAASSLNYTPMENIPGFSSTSDFYTYLMNIYKLGLWIVGLCALFMITIGGFMYITSAANVNNAATGKQIITDALIGLALAMLSYILLYTINPDLVKLKTLSSLLATSSSTSSTSSSGSSSSGSSSSGSSSSSGNTDQANRDKLASYGITINKSDCTSYGQTDCTSLDNLPDTAINELINIKQTCNTSLEVTGGTEAGHTSHGPNLSVVDVANSNTLGDCLNAHRSSFGITKVCTTQSDSKYMYNCNNYWESQSHFHISWQ